MKTQTERDIAFAAGKNVFQQADEKRGSSRAAAARDNAFAAGQNRFSIVNEARDRALDSETETEVAPALETKEARRQRFFGRDAEGRPVGNSRHTTSVIPLDARTEKARQDYHAARSAAKTPTPEPQPQATQFDPVTMSAVILQWQRDRAGVYADTPWNAECFNDCLVDHLIRGENFSYSLLDVVFAELRDGGHLEKKGPRMRGDFTGRSPVAYQRRELLPEEREELVKRQQSAEEAQLHADRTMPLSELAKKVRAGFRDLRTPDLRGTRV